MVTDRTPSARVSCIIPVHDGAAFLAQALASILHQRGAELDVIVVDDGSSDASADIAAGFDGVRVYRQAQAGVAAARNAGVALARGDFIAFLDADDLWLPGKISAQLAALDADPAADYSLTLVRHVAMDGEKAGPLDDGSRLGRLMQCLLVRRAAFDRVGPFDTGTLTRADQDWFLRADALGLRPAIIEKVLVLRRIHGSNHSLANAGQVIDDFLIIAKRNLDRRRNEGALRPVRHWST
ncbi:MAG: glycosyltransferase family A protein [Pseudomonadota bacterium]